MYVPDTRRWGPPLVTDQALKVIPLGGLGAIGKNMMVLEFGDALLVIDSGLMFPDDEMLGIDLVLPDFTYVVENRERVLGIILTHGHEDHVGALPYLLKEVDAPVYGTRLTLGLVNAKLGEHGLQQKVSLNEVSPGKELTLGPFRIEFLEVCHSIPDGVGLGIHTPVGTIVHTGDFKLDQTPIDCRVTAMQRFAELGRNGVLLLLSDSTNADRPGFVSPERSVGESLDGIFALAPGQDHRGFVRQPHPSHPAGHGHRRPSRPVGGRRGTQHGQERQHRSESGISLHTGRAGRTAARHRLAAPRPGDDPQHR